MITDKHGVESRFSFSIIDIESLWVELIPLPDHQASTLCDALDNELYSRYPRPHILLSDQAQERIGTNQPAHMALQQLQQANIISERVHNTINQMMGCTGEENRLVNLQFIAIALREAVHSSLNQSPVELIFGLGMVQRIYIKLTIQNKWFNLAEKRR